MGGCQEQQSDHAQAAQGGAQDIGGVQARRLVAVAAEGQAQGGGGEQEGNEQAEIDQGQTQELAAVPECLQGIERDGLGQQEAADGGDPEQSGGGGEDRLETAQQRIPVQRPSACRRRRSPASPR